MPIVRSVSAMACAAVLTSAGTDTTPLRHEVADATEVVRLVACGVLKLDGRHTVVAHRAYILSLVSKARSSVSS